MSNRAAAVWLVVALLVGALLAALVPVHANEVSCGAAFSNGNFDTSAAQFGDDIADAMSGRDWNTTDYEADCADRRSTQRAFVIPLLIVGALAGGFLLMTNSQSPAPVGQEREK